MMGPVKKQVIDPNTGQPYLIEMPAPGAVRWAYPSDLQKRVFLLGVSPGIGVPSYRRIECLWIAPKSKLTKYAVLK